MNSDDLKYLLHYEAKDDILQTIPDVELPILRDIFTKNWPYNVQPYFLIDQLIKWKKQKPDIGIRFTCPDGQWQDGTFVAILTEFQYQIFFFTLEKTCERLIQALKSTKIIEWKKGPYICAVHDDVDEIIMQTLKSVDGSIEFEIESALWWLSKETALQFEIKMPSDVKLAPLEPTHAGLINAVWPHAFPNSESYIANLIKTNGGFGIFSNEGKLCSWVTVNDYGAVAILQTIDEYKRRGFASLLIKKTAKTAAENGIGSITYIVRKNLVSQALFKSLGFKLINNVRWVQFKLLENRIS